MQEEISQKNGAYDRKLLINRDFGGRAQAVSIGQKNLSQCSGDGNQCQIEDIHAMRDRKMHQKEGDARDYTKGRKVHDYGHCVLLFLGIAQQRIADAIADCRKQGYAQWNKSRIKPWICYQLATKEDNHQCRNLSGREPFVQKQDSD